MRLLTVVFIILYFVVPAMADGWAPMISSHSYGPEQIVAVQKATQTLIMLERKSPLHEVKRFPCTTGQSVGDKLVEGDLRTPEGVYFIGPRIDRTLDWGLYGNLAYSLNYPNPIDRIRGKTGGGIWLHGRGKEFLPRDTRGCVALKESDMRDVAGTIAYGTPVVIADQLAWTQDAGTIDPDVTSVVDELKHWASDWQAKSDDFFAHYDGTLLSLSENLNFQGFVEHKRNVFAAKPWIHVMIDNIHAVVGPDYMVTWFDQFYRTTGMESTTGKRFYWMKDPAGTWRIVGREYVPASEDLAGKYFAAKTQEAKKVVEQWREAWLAGDADRYGEFYVKDAVQGSRRSATRIVDYKKTLWVDKSPVKVSVDDLTVSPHPQGLQVAFIQTYVDESGYSDVGRKTMVFVPDGNSWKIDSEQWRRGK
jgi:murein L,D-transpeptidase YafK